MFTDAIMRMILKWSQERNPASPNCKVFAAETVRGTKDWTDALLWARANVQTMIRVVGEKRYIVFLSRARDIHGRFAILPRFGESLSDLFGIIELSPLEAHQLADDVRSCIE
jgi:hypothetical protein